MKRVIKFRAWDSHQEVMLSFEELKVLDSEGTAYFDVLSGNYQDLTPMQFTGLLDKNGKEIWEGDIIERSDSGVIEFDGGMFGVNWDFGTDKKTMLGAWGTETNLRCLHDGYNRDIEVIGNIYENPDLLK